MRAVLITLAALLVAACGGSAAGEDGHVSVVASFYPLAEAAQRVGGDRVEVRNLTPPGTEPHDLELDPDEVGDVQDADVAIVLGGGFQPAVEEIADRRDGPTVTVLDDGADGDPHVWLDPTKLAGIVEDVTDAVVEADPDGEDTYRADAEAYVAELTALDGELEAGLADCDRDVIVVAHEAFGALAERYGLRQEGIAGISPEQEPDPRRLDELAEVVEQEGVTTVFTEALVSPDVAEALAREVGVETAVLDPIEGLTDDSAGDDYASVMRSNLAALREALGCR